MSGRRPQAGLVPPAPSSSSSSLRSKLSALHGRRGPMGPGSQEDACHLCRCPLLFTPGISRTVPRILAACTVSLLTLLGSISLDLSDSLQRWRNTELALQDLSCRHLVTVALVEFLQEERTHCCWGPGANSTVGGNHSSHDWLLARLAALCREEEERVYHSNSRCDRGWGFSCRHYLDTLKPSLSATLTSEPGSLLSGVISDLLQFLGGPEEDLKALRSNPDQVDVVSLRLILKIKEFLLRAQRRPQDGETSRNPVVSILNFAVLASENLQHCWMERANLSLSLTLSEGIFLFLPFSPSSLSVPEDLKEVQRCLSEKGREKLAEKSRAILSGLSLKVGLLLVTCLIYPIVLVSFKQMTRWIQNYTRNLTERTEVLKQERRLAEDLLHQMLPKSVAKQLRRRKHVEAEDYERVTIFFSDIVGFTSIAASCTPLQVVEMLNSLYICFDTRIESYDVYKVETIGDAYMVVSGLPERNGEKHADEIAKMALDLVAAVRQVLVPHMPLERLQLRAGIHTGPCVAGVVGYKMPRYCLFGDTVNTASRMESTSLPQKIHISSATYQALLIDDTYEIEFRGEIDVKGKGKMKTYWLIGNKNYSVQNDSLVCHWNPSMARRKKVESSQDLIQHLSSSPVGVSAIERFTRGSVEESGSPSWAVKSPLDELTWRLKTASPQSSQIIPRYGVPLLGSPQPSNQGDRGTGPDTGHGQLGKGRSLPGFVEGTE